MRSVPDTNCLIPSHEVPQHLTTILTHTPTSHVDSRILPGVTGMRSVLTETQREDSDRSAYVTHCEQRVELREKKFTTNTQSADACLSLARVAYKLCVVVKNIRIRAAGN